MMSMVAISWLMIVVMMISGGLFAAGGTDIPGIGGQKWLRRMLLRLKKAEFSILDKSTEDLSYFTKKADILISGVGKSGLSIVTG